MKRAWLVLILLVPALTQAQVEVDHVEVGTAALFRGDLAGAEAEFTTALRAAPQDAFAWFGRAMARSLLAWPQIQKDADRDGRLHRLIEDDYLEALSYDPDVAAHWVRARRGRDAEVRDFLSKIEIFAATHNLRGQNLMTENKIKESLAELDRAVALRPEEPFLRYVRGFMNMRGGDRKLAMADWNLMIERAKTDPATDKLVPLVYEQRALMFVEANDLEHAWTDVNEAIRRSPKNGGMRVTRARILFAAGRLDQALAAVNEGMAIDAKMSDAYKVRAAIYEKGGDAAHARADLATAAAIEGKR